MLVGLDKLKVIRIALGIHYQLMVGIKEDPIQQAGIKVILVGDLLIPIIIIPLGGEAIIIMVGERKEIPTIVTMAGELKEIITIAMVGEHKEIITIITMVGGHKEIPIMVGGIKDKRTIINGAIIMAGNLEITTDGDRFNNQIFIPFSTSMLHLSLLI
jgi:hypothetical protein